MAGVEVETKVKIDWLILGRDLAAFGSSVEQSDLLNAMGSKLRELGGDGLMQAAFIYDNLGPSGKWLVEQLREQEGYDGE